MSKRLDKITARSLALKLNHTPGPQSSAFPTERKQKNTIL